MSPTSQMMDDIQQYALEFIGYEYAVTGERALLLFRSAYAKKPVDGKWTVIDLKNKMIELAPFYITEEELAAAKAKREKWKARCELREKLSGLADRELLEEIYAKLFLL